MGPALGQPSHLCSARGRLRPCPGRQEINCGPVRHAGDEGAEPRCRASDGSSRASDGSSQTAQSTEIQAHAGPWVSAGQDALPAVLTAACPPHRRGASPRQHGAESRHAAQGCSQVHAQTQTRPHTPGRWAWKAPHMGSREPDSGVKVPRPRATRAGTGRRPHSTRVTHPRPPRYTDGAHTLHTCPVQARTHRYTQVTWTRPSLLPSHVDTALIPKYWPPQGTGLSLVHPWASSVQRRDRFPSKAVTSWGGFLLPCGPRVTERVPVPPTSQQRGTCLLQAVTSVKSGTAPPPTP